MVLSFFLVFCLGLDIFWGFWYLLYKYQVHWQDFLVISCEPVVLSWELSWDFKPICFLGGSRDVWIRTKDFISILLFLKGGAQ